ncbi:MAG: type II secretion system protein GspC [Proteobacteria bacterium]|nr:type II secretion system protein GspC [Pseudomonadota bacterium]
MNAASWLEALPPQERWGSLLLKEGPRIATWALALGLGVQAALLVTDMAGTGAKPAPATAQARQRPPLDVLAITNAHLFGAAPAAAQDPNSASPSNIPLVLTGTIAGNDPQSGLAILGPNPQSAKVYAVGDMLPGNVRLHSVYVDRVIIDRNGQLESIALPHQSAGAAPPPSVGNLAAVDNPPLERMRRMVSEQPNLIGDVLRATPVFDKGRVTGFRVYPGRDRTALAKLGLHPGDQVTAINGTPLDDRDRGDQILKTLSSASEARVTIIRNGQTQDLTLNLAQVAQEAEGLAAQQVQTASGGLNVTAAATSNAAAAAAQASGGSPEPNVAPAPPPLIQPPPDQQQPPEPGQ